MEASGVVVDIKIRGDAEFLFNVFSVRFDTTLFDEQVICDLLVGFSVGYKFENFNFAKCEGIVVR